MFVLYLKQQIQSILNKLILHMQHLSCDDKLPLLWQLRLRHSRFVF
jgi:hypothetical protein